MSREELIRMIALTEYLLNSQPWSATWEKELRSKIEQYKNQLEQPMEKKAA